MAQSGEFSTSISYIKYRIIITESSTSTSNNTSTVRVQINAWSDKSGTSHDYDGQSRIKIDGVEYPVSSWSKGQKVINYSSDHGATGYTTIYDSTHTVYHNYDGTKKIRVSAYFEYYESVNQSILNRSLCFWILSVSHHQHIYHIQKIYCLLLRYLVLIFHHQNC